MAKIRKGELLPHLVMVDTNILWCKDKSHAVNPEFDAFWDEYSKQAPLELLVPEVVRGELSFQQTTSAVKARKQITESLEKVSAITNRLHSHRITDNRIKTQVISKIDKWIKRRQASVKPTPVNAVDWNALINKAIWREPPFEFNEKEKTEKGFRDALILETLLDCCESETRDVQMVFITNDYLLRHSAKEKLNKQCLVYESLDDFSSYLRLTHEKLTNEFANKLLQKASLKFFNKEDGNDLYTREKIADRIRKEHKHLFEDPLLSGDIQNSSSAIIQASLTPMYKLVWWIYPASFERCEKGKQFFWCSNIAYVRPYYSMVSRDANLLVLSFKAKWWANVKADGRFYDMTFESIDLHSNVFEKISDEQIKYYRIPPEELIPTILSSPPPPLFGSVNE